MKHLILSFIVGLLGGLVGRLAVKDASASTVNPASNVTADSANTPGTIVLRDYATGVASITLATGNVDTAKIAAGSIDTSKLLGLEMAIPNGSAICAKSTGGVKAFGYCSTTPTNGVCTCN